MPRPRTLSAIEIKGRRLNRDFMEDGKGGPPLFLLTRQGACLNRVECKCLGSSSSWSASHVRSDCTGSFL
jgi:hypothetical protein